MSLQQRLIPRSLAPQPNAGQLNSTSLSQGVQASVMDPLWFLSRQWQMGEFKAENCGSISSVNIDDKIIPLSHVYLDDGISKSIIQSNNQPIEPIVESSVDLNDNAELDIPKALKAPISWKSRNLEYSFSVGSNEEELLAAKEYFGEKVDWYSFSITNSFNFSQSLSQNHPVFPQPVRFPGMPKARWWQFEDANIDLGDIQRPNLNFLSILLTEFALLYSNDWFIIPVQQPVGSLRKIENLLVTDVFGNTSTAKPHDSGNQGFTIFSLTNEKQSNITDSSILLLPNALTNFVQGEALEEVIFSRDEMANLVWATEQKYFDEATLGMIKIWNNEQTPDTKNKEGEEFPMDNSESNQDGLPVYKIMSPVQTNWIPYISVQKNTGGQIYFRRGKTTKDKNKQFKTKIIENSARVWEEEIPTTPIAITQNAKMIVYDADKWVYGQRNVEDGKIIYEIRNDGKMIRLVWIGRKKNRSVRQNSSDLKFDYLIE